MVYVTQDLYLLIMMRPSDQIPVAIFPNFDALTPGFARSFTAPMRQSV
jgi:hypothetical protein